MTQSTVGLPATDVQTIATEAYIYTFPLVLMDITRRQATNVEAGKTVGRGPMQTFTHARAFPDATFRDVVRPNFDTLYSVAWIDLTEGPLIVSAPDTAGRYYLLPMLDMWSDVFAVPGKRTTGTAAGQFALVPAGWSGTLPSGVQRIDAPTAYVWIIGRTQTNGPKDYDAVHRVQDGYTLTPLSRWGQPAQLVQVAIDPTVDMHTPPMDQLKQMPAAAYFQYAAELMKLHPPHATDWSTVARLKRVGMEPGQSFNIEQQPPAVRQALEAASASGMQAMLDKAPTFARVVNGWQMNTDTMGVYGNYYLKRAYVALVGLGANQPEDAVYPLNLADADGRQVMGEHNYIMHFAADALPPAGAFWSLTMYDAEGFQVANPLNRFAIGDRDALQFNPDGSLDLYVQHASPGTTKESNWLPSAAQGPLGLTMRLYAPQPTVLDGRWSPPAVNRIN
ncbi:MAG TPA: DUF1254 domain-containing protein [Chloroflexota bacterium]|jgi:hypothetical protein